MSHKHNHSHCHSHCHCHCHNHSHSHSHSHSHNHHSNSKLTATVIITAAALTAAGLCIGMLSAKISAMLLVIAAAVAVAKPAADGIRGLFRLEFDESLLLTVAVAAAILIGEFAEAALVSVLFCIGQYIEAKASTQSHAALKALSEIRPDTVHTDDGDRPAEQVQIGDAVIIRPYERLPIDCRVISGESEVDAAAITGESLPIVAKAGTALLGGMQNGEGVLRCEATSGYYESTASRIIKLVEDSVQSKGSAERFITRFARIYTPLVIIAAVLVAFIPSVILGELSVEWLKKSLVFLVAACPCALVISVPLAFFAAIGAASKQGVLIKGGVHIEQLARVRAAALDKTGTLTEGELSVVKTVDFTEKNALAVAAAAEAHSDHPIARAIRSSCPNPAKLNASFTEQAGFGIRLKGEHNYSVGSKRLMLSEKVDASAAQDATVYVAEDGILIGAIYVADTPRKDAKLLTEGLKRRGFTHIAMLTGDSAATAKEVASACGINSVYAELLPEDKVNIIEQLAANRCGTLFVGDGINDAPVIAAADVGVAMGLGTSAAIETADVILSSGKPSSLLTAIDISRRTMGTVKFNLALSITVKLAVIGSAFFVPVMWLAVVADVVLTVLCSANSARLLRAGRR